MQFATKLASLLLAITASSLRARSAVIARHDLAGLSVVFFDRDSFTGTAYYPDGLVQAVCNTLPEEWLDRPAGVEISSGYSCLLYEFQGCEGPGVSVSGSVGVLPDTLYDNVESFICTKAI